MRAARAMTGRVSLVAARSPLFIEMGLADDAVDELRRGRFVLFLLIRDDCPIGIPDLRRSSLEKKTYAAPNH